MKRICILLVIILSVATCFAEGIDCTCNEVPCKCFVQRYDNGMCVRMAIMRLKALDYCPLLHEAEQFDEQIEDALMRFQADNSLPQSGVLDDDTLTMLIWGEMSNDGETIQEVWISTDGGTHRHRTSSCSSMNKPRKISQRNALAMGFEPCQNCFS